MIKVDLVPTNIIDQVWPQVVDGFQKASDRFGGDLTTGDLWQMCRSGSAFLFVVHENNEVLAATAWRPEIWGKGPRFRCLALYGRGVKQWKDDLRSHVETAARQCGAKALIADGRLGWRAIFPDAKVLRAVYEAAI